jgi:hypothetical protein
MEALLYKKLLIYLIPFNYLFGDYNMGLQYRYSDAWAIDVNVGYIDDIHGTSIAGIYEDLFKSEKFYYHGPFIKTSFVSLFARGFNPFRTDYNQIEMSYKLLSYDGLDFYDPLDTTGKVFNKSEILQAIGFSWIAGYNIVNGETFHLDGFLGFGLQFRFSNILYNSYGYNNNSDQYYLGDYERSMQLVPLLHAGVKVGLWMLPAKPNGGSYP